MGRRVGRRGWGEGEGREEGKESEWRKGRRGDGRIAGDKRR